MLRHCLRNELLTVLLLVQAVPCHAGTTFTSSRSWSSSITTRSYSTSSQRRIAPAHIARKKSVNSSPSSRKGSAAHSVIKKVGYGKNDNNCVLFLRQQRGLHLPRINLTTFAAKLSIINARFPRPHSVAIIRTPGANAGIGHLAEVIDVEQKNGRVSLRLYEANNPRRGYYVRTIRGRSVREIEKTANIAGYYVEPSLPHSMQRRPITITEKPYSRVRP